MVTKFNDITFYQIYGELDTKVDGISKESFLVHENTSMIVKDNALDPHNTFQRLLMDQGQLILLFLILVLWIFELNCMFHFFSSK